MKNLKKIVQIWIVLGVLISCQLADGGRKAGLEIHLSKTDELSDIQATMTSENTRVLVPGTNRLEIILYKPFSGDNVVESTKPEAADIDMIKQRADTLVYTFTFDASAPSGMIAYISEIEPGDWNIILGAFHYNDEKWGGGGEIGPLSYRVFKNLSLEGGVNSVDSPLKINLDAYVNTIATDHDSFNITAVQNKLLSNDIDANFRGLVFDMTGLTPGANKMGVNYGIQWPSLYSLYDQEGVLLDQINTSLSNQELNWDVTSSSNRYILVCTPIGSPINYRVTLPFLDAYDQFGAPRILPSIESMEMGV